MARPVVYITPKTVGQRSLKSRRARVRAVGVPPMTFCHTDPSWAALCYLMRVDYGLTAADVIRRALADTARREHASRSVARADSSG
jgi:hypothetical protein